MELKKKFDEMTYVDSYLDTLEEVGLKVARHVSKLQTAQWHHLNLLEGLDTAMEQLLDGNQCDLNLNNFDKTKKKAMKDLEQLLVSALQIGDEAMETSQKVEDLLEEKLTELNEAGTGPEVAAAAAPSPVKSAPTPTTSSEEDDDIDEDDIEYCLCEQGSSGKMIECSNHLCPIEWFHFSCVALKKTPKGDWFCPMCRGDKKGTKMRPMSQFCKELAKYNKEKEKKVK